MEIQKLIEIANSVHREDIIAELKSLENRLKAPNKEIVMPLVGEFSSGKTSLINALLEDSNLETASKATTATIFEIYFGKEKSYAEVVDGEKVELFEKVEDIKNDEVAERELVRVYDTSNKIPDSTILVDTPGLSSNDSQHKIALTGYLPKSDAILLVTDVNQQITKSLVDFVEDFKLSNKPIYLVINKCDTKTEGEVQSVKKYIADNIKISIDDMVCVSATKGNLEELYHLLDKVQKNKNEIVNNAICYRIEGIKRNLSVYIKDLLTNISSSSSLQDMIDDQQFHLRKINDNIDTLIRDAERKVEDITDNCKRTFSNHISDKLEAIVVNQGRDIDANIYSSVNQTSGIMLQNYSKDIVSVLKNLARDRKSQINAVPLQGLEALDFSDTIMSFDYDYNMDLSSMGHQYDKRIGYGTLALAAAATIYFSGGTAVLAGGMKTVVKEEGGVIKAVKKVGGDVIKSQLGIKGNSTQEDKEKKEPTELEKLSEKYNQTLTNLQNNEKVRGVIETSVGWITDGVLGKPQRKKAVREYVEGYLIPEFSNHLESRKSDIIRSVSDLLREEVRNSTQHMEEEIRNLKAQQENEIEVYNERVKVLNEYIKILQ